MDDIPRDVAPGPARSTQGFFGGRHSLPRHHSEAADDRNAEGAPRTLRRGRFAGSDKTWRAGFQTGGEETEPRGSDPPARPRRMLRKSQLPALRPLIKTLQNPSRS